MRLELNAEIYRLANEHIEYANNQVYEVLEDVRQKLLASGFTPEDEEYQDAYEIAQDFALQDWFGSPFSDHYLAGVAYELASEVSDYNLFHENPTVEDFMRANNCRPKAIAILTEKFGQLFVTV